MPIKPTVLKIYMINGANGERTDVTKELPSILFDAIHECSKRISKMENKHDIIFRIIGSKGDYVVECLKEIKQYDEYNTPWEAWEDDILKKYYASKGAKECCDEINKEWHKNLVLTKLMKEEVTMELV